MAMDVNSVILVGRLTKDIELKYPQNKPVATFCIAVNHAKEDDVSFFNITVFGKIAENCSKYIGQGSQVIVSGELKQNKWTDKNGNTQYSISIIGRQVEFLGNSKDNERY